MNKKPRLSSLATEGRNRRSMKLDALSTAGIVRLINQEDQAVARAVERALPQITRAVDVVVKQMHRGGRLFYVGAGTSGRIGILDAVECVPTFNTSPQQIQGVIGGGYEACYRAVEAGEDSAAAGAHDLRKRRLTRRDVLVGLAASGRTLYTCGALRFAKSLRAKTIAIVNNPHSEMKQIADITIEALTGPEVLTGSTRMKAGTAQKMICNMISTAAMVRLGAVYSNLMINVHLKNEKLMARGVKILQEITGADAKTARAALAAAEHDLKVATMMLAGQFNAAKAATILKRNKHNLRKALLSAGCARER